MSAFQPFYHRTGTLCDKLLNLILGGGLWSDGVTPLGKLSWAPLLLFGLDLSFTELGDFMPISTCGHAAPLPAMILSRVVKIEHARGRIGAPVDIIEISLGQKTGNLVGDQVKGKLFAVEMGLRASNTKSFLSVAAQDFVKNVQSKKSIEASEKGVADLPAGDEFRKYFFPRLAKF